MNSFMWKSVCQSSERLLAAAAALVVFSVSASSQYRTDASYSSLYDSETVAAFKNHIGYVAASSMEGRAPGSEGEKAAAEYVYETLSSYGVDMLCPKDGDTFGIALDGGDTLTSRNVFGFVQGYDKELKDRYIVIGARLDNLGVNTMTVDGRTVDQIYYGANGNASGLAMMMELRGWSARIRSFSAVQSYLSLSELQLCPIPEPGILSTDLFRILTGLTQ